MEYTVYEGKITGWNWDGNKQIDNFTRYYSGTNYCMLYNKIIEDYEQMLELQKHKHLHFLIWEDDCYILNVNNQRHSTEPKQQTDINENAPQDQF